MIDRLVIFGATGDLAGRYLLPALAGLLEAGSLPEDFELVGAGREELDDQAFRAHAERELDEFSASPARDGLLGRMSYRQVDIDDREAVASVVGTDRPVAAYLALPPATFPAAARAFGAAGLPAGSRLVFEKPFGESLEDAIALNRLLDEEFGDRVDDLIYRVDHILGMSTLQNLAGLRFGNRLFEGTWNSEHVERVELLWEEELALEGRAGYFDSAGALRDVMQNHLMQLLCLVAMEAPANARELPMRKVELLKAVRPPAADQMASRTRRARYTAGRLAEGGGGKGRTVPDYAAEDGVDPERGTETFAEFELTIENPRWAGTRFVMRAGKALADRRKEAVLHYRPVGGNEFPEAQLPGRLRIGIDGPEDIELQVNGSPDTFESSQQFRLSGEPSSDGTPPYGRVLLDILRGSHELSVGGEEAELGWRVVTPILEAWEQDQVVLGEYPAGSPSEPIDLIA